MPPATTRSTEISQLLGLAQRAGHVVRGTEAVRGALRDGRARLVVLADDASPTQVKKIEGLIRGRDVPVARVASRSELGMALGAAPLASVAVTDEGFAHRLLDELQSEAARLHRAPTVPGDRQTYAG